jgi:hypothetical protein
MNVCAPELYETVGTTSALDITGRAAGNATDLSSWDGNDRALEHSGTVDTLDINGGVEGHGCNVRPVRPLGHSTHCTQVVVTGIAVRLSSLGQSKQSAHLTSMDERLVIPLAYGAGIGTTMHLCSPGQSKWRAHMTSRAEWRAIAATCDKPDLLGTPPTTRQLLVATVIRESLFDRCGENACPTTVSMQRRMPQSTQSMLGPIGPDISCDISVLPQWSHLGPSGALAGVDGRRASSTGGTR